MRRIARTSPSAQARVARDPSGAAGPHPGKPGRRPAPRAGPPSTSRPATAPGSVRQPRQAPIRHRWIFSTAPGKSGLDFVHDERLDGRPHMPEMAWGRGRRCSTARAGDGESRRSSASSTTQRAELIALAEREAPPAAPSAWLPVTRGAVALRSVSTSALKPDPSRGREDASSPTSWPPIRCLSACYACRRRRTCGWPRSRTAPTATTATRACCRSAARASTRSERARRAPSRCSSGVLRARSRQPAARWLLNIAHMTLGSYPDGVPPTPSDPAAAVRVGASAAALRQRRDGQSGSTSSACRAARSSTTSTATAASTSWSRHRLRRPDARSSTTTATARSRTARDEAGLTGEIGGLNMVAGRLRQRRPARRARPARRLDGARGQVPALAAAQQRRRHVQRTSPRRAGLLRFAPDADRDLVRLRRRRLARPLRRQRVRRSDDDASPCELFHNNRDGTFTNVAREAGVDLRRLRQGRGERRLRQRRPARPLSCRAEAATTCCSTTTGPRGGDGAAGASRTSTPTAGVDEPLEQLRRRSSSTTTTTAGSTSSSRATASRQAMAERRGRRLPRACRRHAERGRPLPATTATARSSDVTEGGRPVPGDPGDGAQLRRPRQRRLARLLPRHRQPRPRARSCPTGCSATTAASASRT